MQRAELLDLNIGRVYWKSNCSNADLPFVHETSLLTNGTIQVGEKKDVSLLVVSIEVLRNQGFFFINSILEINLQGFALLPIGLTNGSKITSLIVNDDQLI